MNKYELDSKLMRDLALEFGKQVLVSKTKHILNERAKTEDTPDDMLWSEIEQNIPMNMRYLYQMFNKLKTPKQFRDIIEGFLDDYELEFTPADWAKEDWEGLGDYMNDLATGELDNKYGAEKYIYGDQSHDLDEATDNLSYLKGTQFKYMGNTYTIKDIDIEDGRRSIITTNGKYFNYDMLLGKGVEFKDKPMPFKGKMAGKKQTNKRMSKYQYEKELKDMVEGLEDYQIADAAIDLSSRNDIQEYIKRAYGITNKQTTIEQIKVDMESYLEY